MVKGDSMHHRQSIRGAAVLSPDNTHAQALRNAPLKHPALAYNARSLRLGRIQSRTMPLEMPVLEVVEERNPLLLVQ